MLQVFGNVGVVLALISFGVAILSLVLILYFANGRLERGAAS